MVIAAYIGTTYCGGVCRTPTTAKLHFRRLAYPGSEWGKPGY